MTSPQNLDATLCLLASLISKQVPNPAQLKRDLESGAKHFQAGNPELGNLLGRMSDAIKNADNPTKGDTTADHAMGRTLGLQSLLFSVIRALDNSNEVFSNFHIEIEHARASLLEINTSEAARQGLDDIAYSVSQLQQEL